MQLPQVDVVGAQPCERGVERGEQVAARGVPAPEGRHRDRLRRDLHRRPWHDRPDQLTENLLGAAVRIDVGGVDEGAADVAERLELLGGVVRFGVPPPGHRSQREPGHHQPAVAEGTQFHGSGRYRRPAPHRSTDPPLRCAVTSPAAGREWPKTHRSDGSST
jgi:hypothetical protein